ncbi:hypothetical protein DM01DRAFT_1304354 [Hesseltinella vesiculosa]|uniref:WRKY domain-containing protein n=1 Tax=Hesseltinella vesiculosa TaxID=101127 RepID=A0A1X2GKI5_9FUNG|nr:hypothetical protein DM01DRAFT_1304354 [Hesseltinella vesiculosa]
MSELTCTSTPYKEDLASPPADAPLYELQDVIHQFKSSPEILKLILTSKVEEDKRRAEEAKLRAKQLDYYMKRDGSASPPPCLPSLDDITMLPPISPFRKMPLSPRSTKERFHPYPSSVDHTSDQRRHSAAAAMLAMGNCLPPSPPTPSDHYAASQGSASDEEIEQSPSYPTEQEDCQDDDKPRRRREMQAITKIVETREFPYMDSYFWRNNGNTTQKKTGCRSIYYKCSNSSKVKKIGKATGMSGKGRV